MAFRHLGANSRGADMTKSQKDKYLKFNDAIDLLADATQQKMNLFVGISSGNTLTLGDEDFTENFVFHCRDEPGSPTLDGNWVLRVPATMRNFAVMNDTSFLMFVESAGSPGTQVEIPTGGRAHLHSDGESIIEIKRDVWDITAFTNVMTAGAKFAFFPAAHSFKLNAGLAGSLAYAYSTLQAADPDFVISIQKNDVEVGTITFTALDNDGVFAMASDTTWAIGDRFTLVNNADESPSGIANMGDVGITLKAVLL